MTPPCKTSHTFLMNSQKPGCQHKTRKKFPEYLKFEQSKASKKKKMRVSKEEFYETGKVRIKRRVNPEKYPRLSQKARPTIRRRQKNPGTIKENSRAAQEEKNCKYVFPPFIAHSPNISIIHNPMST